MSIFSSLYVAMSGIRSNEVGMGIIGDNIANMNTIGFKGSRGVFSDILNTTIMGEPGLSEREAGRKVGDAGNTRAAPRQVSKYG